MGEMSEISNASPRVMSGVLSLAVIMGLGCGRPSPTPDASKASPVSAAKAEAERPSSPSPESTAEPASSAPTRIEADPAVQAEATAPVEPKVDLGAMSEKMGRRLRSKLRQQVSARVELRVVETEAEPDEGHSVFALFEYSSFEACVSKAGGGKKGREHCAEPLDDALGQQQRACTQLGLAHARFGPASPADPGYGGELELLATQRVETECVFHGVPRFVFVDIDADGQRELEVEIHSASWDWAFREQYAYAVDNRRIGWYREDLSPQLELDLKGCPGDIVNATYCSVGRYHFEDENGDGHVDLALESVGYQLGSYEATDEFGWPDEHPLGDEEYDDYDWEYNLDSHDKSIRIYDPGKDEWIAG